jgi:N-acetylneuraminic acid mutarotase
MWRQKANFPGEERDGAMSFVINNKAYLAGGIYNHNPMNDVWDYNPSNDSWTRKADWPGTLRYSGVGFSIGTNGYLGIGQTGPLGSFLKDLWEYNSLTDTWIRKIEFPFEGRGTAVSFIINGKAYAGTGGTTTRFYRDLWKFTP